MLALPDFTKQFEIETDACDVGVGAVLLQGGHPIAFVSRGLGPRTKGLSTYEKEYIAILLAVENISTACRVFDSYRSQNLGVIGRAKTAHTMAAEGFYQAIGTPISH